MWEILFKQTTAHLNGWTNSVSPSLHLGWSLNAELNYWTDFWTYYVYAYCSKKVSIKATVREVLRCWWMCAAPVVATCLRCLWCLWITALELILWGHMLRQTLTLWRLLTTVCTQHCLLTPIRNCCHQLTPICTHHSLLIPIHAFHNLLTPDSHPMLSIYKDS